MTRVPYGKDEINHVYGNPDRNEDGILDRTWFDRNIEVIELAFPLRKSWALDELVYRIQCHRLVSLEIKEILSEIGAWRGGAYLDQRGYNVWGGCFNFRFAKGNPKALSTHSWGIAVDLNPELAPFGEPDHEQPTFIIEIFKSHGWISGADWPEPYTDGMHFQRASGY